MEVGRNASELKEQRGRLYPPGAGSVDAPLWLETWQMIGQGSTARAERGGDECYQNSKVGMTDHLVVSRLCRDWANRSV